MSPTHNCVLPAPDGQPADIIHLIMADHRRIRRLRDVLVPARCAADSGPGWMLAHAWQRMADVLEAHTRAEEEICYLSMFGTGQHGDWRDAVAGNDDIREAISDAALMWPGSARWWLAVRAAIAAATEHVERTERGALARWQLHLTAGQRREFGRQWSAFIAAWTQDAAIQDDGRPPAHGVPRAGGTSGPDRYSGLRRRSRWQATASAEE